MATKTAETLACVLLLVVGLQFSATLASATKPTQHNQGGSQSAVGSSKVTADKDAETQVIFDNSSEASEEDSTELPVTEDVPTSSDGNAENGDGKDQHHCKGRRCNNRDSSDESNSNEDKSEESDRFGNGKERPNKNHSSKESEEDNSNGQCSNKGNGHRGKRRCNKYQESDESDSSEESSEEEEDDLSVTTLGPISEDGDEEYATTEAYEESSSTEQEQKSILFVGK